MHGHEADGEYNVPNRVPLSATTTQKRHCVSILRGDVSALQQMERTSDAAGPENGATMICRL